MISGFCQEGRHEPLLEMPRSSECRMAIVTHWDERLAADEWAECQCACHPAAKQAKLQQQAQRFDLEVQRAANGLRGLAWDNTMDALIGKPR